MCAMTLDDIASKADVAMSVYGQVPNKGFKSASSLKRYMGNAGKGNAWHHIVENSQIKASDMGQTLIHNVNNIIAII